MTIKRRLELIREAARNVIIIERCNTRDAYVVSEVGFKLLYDAIFKETK